MVSRTSKSNRETSWPYCRLIKLSVRFFPFRAVTSTEKAMVRQTEIEPDVGGHKTDQRMFKRCPFENVA